MTVLSDRRIRELCEQESPLIRDAINFKEQLQPAGFDVTVRSVARLVGNATIGGPYQSHVAQEITVEPSEGFYSLKPGPYLVYINEYTAIPAHITGLVLPRSTLFRCGGILQSGAWDSGFNGRGRLGLFVPDGITLSIQTDAPIAQIIFFDSPGVENLFAFNQFHVEG